jgi:hypothetical protein
MAVNQKVERAPTTPACTARCAPADRFPRDMQDTKVATTASAELTRAATALPSEQATPARGLLRVDQRRGIAERQDERRNG